MGYTTSYTLTAFDAATSKMTADVSILYNGAVTEVITVTVTIPVDDRGYVTTDQHLIDSYIQAGVDRQMPYLAQRVPAGGVVNASLIYAMTTATETEELALGTCWVLLTADPDYTGLNNLCTRSVITVITNRLDYAPPPEDAGYSITGLDNGNVVLSQGLSLVQTAGELEQTGPFNIIAANDNTATLPVPPWVYTAFPNFLDNTQVTWEQGFRGYQYYIEHQPIVINTTATALFSY